MTGIELSQCYPMLTSHMNPFTQLGNTLRGEKKYGRFGLYDVGCGIAKSGVRCTWRLPWSSRSFRAGYRQDLGDGFKPAYDPNTVLKNWQSLVRDDEEESKLVNRASQGLYPPGSTFKIVTAMEYMMENPDSYKEYRYRCKGTKVFSGSRINCYSREWHGRLSLPTAFAKSCNGAFADIGTRLDLNSYRKFCEKLYFNQKPSVEFEANKSRFALNAKSDAAEVTQTAIGQGKTLITPLENAMITAMVANGGEMMKPYVVDRVESADGRIVKQYKPKSQGKLVDEWVTEAMTGMMEKVVNEGTGTLLKTSAYQVAGKTGSAEADSDGTTRIDGYHNARDGWYSGIEED